MLSYQHIYHAGNFADVQKHLWLIATLHYLQKHNRPIHWLDTHGGRGLYDLSSPESQKIGEYSSGFIAFRDTRSNQSNLSEIEHCYLNMVRETSSRRKLYYPGSALITAKILGKNDYLEVCELHKGEIPHLYKAMEPFSHAKTLKEDGYKCLDRLAKEHKFGGALIDPSYEIKSEYDDVLTRVKSALKIWRNGTFLIWYPLLPAGLHAPMVKGFQTLAEDDIDIQIEDILIRDKDTNMRGLYGSGMIIINGPNVSFKNSLESIFRSGA